MELTPTETSPRNAVDRLLPVEPVIGELVLCWLRGNVGSRLSCEPFPVIRFAPHISISVAKMVGRNGSGVPPVQSIPAE